MNFMYLINFPDINRNESSVMKPVYPVFQYHHLVSESKPHNCTQKPHQSPNSLTACSYNLRCLDALGTLAKVGDISLSFFRLCFLESRKQNSIRRIFPSKHYLFSTQLVLGESQILLALISQQNVFHFKCVKS